MFSYQTKQKERSGRIIQPKLKIGQPGDKYEQEADAVADRVMNMNQSDTMQMQPIEEEEVVQPKLRMQPMEEEEEMMQAKSNGTEGLVSPGIVQQLNSSSGRGQSLSTQTNNLMSNAFGTDFSGVKIHMGSIAAEMNQQIGARAFTHRNNIYFNSGEYDPDNSKGKRLLAHELTHVVQQKGEDTIRRAPVDTYGGTFDTTDYRAINTGAGVGKRVGAHIRLDFTPNNLVVADNIGLTQTVRTLRSTVAGGAVTDTTGTPSARKRSLGTTTGDIGTALDQGDPSSGDTIPNTNPLYAVENAPGSVSSNLTDVGATAGFGQHGSHLRRPNGTFEAPVDAILDDTPGRRVAFLGQEWSQSFEATALVLDGPMSNTYLGSVNWGWSVDATGNATLNPPDIAIASFGVPSGTFMDAGQVWNDAQFTDPTTGTVHDTVDLPLSTHTTVDPGTLTDVQLHRRARIVSDMLMSERRGTPNYQNMSFEIRGLMQEAINRGGAANDSGHIYTVAAGDTMWDIAANQLGSGIRWTHILALNVENITFPFIIRAGERFKMPQPYTP